MQRVAGRQQRDPRPACLAAEAQEEQGRSWLVPGCSSPPPCQAALCNARPTILPALLTSPHAAGKAAKEAGSSSPENAFIRGVIALHDKYMEYVQVPWVVP